MGVDISKEMSDAPRDMSASKPDKPESTKPGASEFTPEKPMAPGKRRLSPQMTDTERSTKKRVMPLTDISAGSPGSPGSESTPVITPQKISTPTEPAGPYTGPHHLIQARILQQSNVKEFRDWVPSDGDGPEEGWEQSPILFNPVVPPTDVEEFPRRRFLSDAAVLALVNVCEKGQRGKLAPADFNTHRDILRGKLAPADFNTHGDILRERICRGLPAMTEDGKIVRYGGRDLRGEIQLAEDLVPDFLDLEKGQEIPDQLFGPDLDFYQQKISTHTPSKEELKKERNFQNSLKERQLKASQKLLSGQSGSTPNSPRLQSPENDSIDPAGPELNAGNAGNAGTESNAGTELNSNRPVITHRRNFSGGVPSPLARPPIMGNLTPLGGLAGSGVTGLGFGRSDAADDVFAPAPRPATPAPRPAQTPTSGPASDPEAVPRPRQTLPSASVAATGGLGYMVWGG